MFDIIKYTFKNMENKAFFRMVISLMNSIPKDIIYFVPHYTENGDSVLILFLSGEKKIVPMSIRSFSKKLYSLYAIDCQAIQKTYRTENWYKKIFFPLFFRMLPSFL